MDKNRIKELRNSTSPKITLSNLSDSVNKILKEKNVLVNNKILQVTDSQLSQYENGKRSPRHPDIWNAIAEVLGVTTPYLMGISSSNVLKDDLEELKFYIDIAKKGDRIVLKGTGEDVTDTFLEMSDILEESDIDVDVDVDINNTAAKASTKLDLYREADKKRLLEIYDSLDVYSRISFLDYAEFLKQKHDTNYFPENRKGLFDERLRVN